MSERLKVLLIEHDPGFATAMGEMLGRAREFSAELQSAPDLRAGLTILTTNGLMLPSSMFPFLTAPVWAT